MLADFEPTILYLRDIHIYNTHIQPGRQSKKKNAAMYLFAPRVPNEMNMILIHCSRPY